MRDKYIIVEIVIAMAPQIYVARAEEHGVGRLTTIPFYAISSGPYDTIADAQDEVDDLMISEA